MAAFPTGQTAPPKMGSERCLALAAIDAAHDHLSREVGIA